MSGAASPLQRVRNSLAYRSGPVYHRILASLRQQPFTEEMAAKERLPLTLLTMCGRNHLLMMNQCLHSLARAWKKLPALHVVSDGTMTPEELAVALEWWKGEKRYSTREDAIRYHEAKGRRGVVHYASNHIMGVKLAVQMEAAERGPTLWCDNDILWFRHFDVERLINDPSIRMRCSADLTPSYDADLVSELFTELPNFRYCCAGLNYLNGNLLDTCDTGPYMRYIETKFGYFTEQTFIAELARQLKSEPFAMDEIAMVTNDAQTLAPTFQGKPWAARHYVTPVRHLFWRDAFHFRMKN